jgi:uncharacterized protein YdaU (DUF1376 family)
MSIVERDPTRSQASAHRDRYVRTFPKRWGQYLQRLSPREIVAYQSVLMEYAQRECDLPDDDKLLASISGLSVKAWTLLRARLIEFGFARAADGKWHDDDQAESIERQVAYSKTQSLKALKRFRHAA